MKNQLIVTLFTLLFVSFISAQSSEQKNDEIEQQVKTLLKRMTLEEKIGQLNQQNFTGVSDKLLTDIREGRIGSIINIVDPDVANLVQEVASKESRLKIPLIIGRDVIHGFKTIFPIPLGQAASFNPALVQAGARIAATEARESGVNWTFAPMLDISRDARWGRIAESFGEDPFLTGELGASMVRGFQGENLSNMNSIAACVKHFVAYGAAEGGRDYNSTNVPLSLLHNIYLPPFKKSIEAGAQTVMTAFNDNNGIPSSGNEYLLKKILRKDWGFDGFVVSDWCSIEEMISHGFAQDQKDAARLAIKAGLDMEMVSGTYLEHIPELIKSKKITIHDVDNLVANILRVKLRLDLFNHPYTDTTQSSAYNKEHLNAARKAAVESAVLLKNNGILPLKETTKIALIGPMAHAPHEQLGTWIFDGDKNKTVTPLLALKTEFNNIEYVYEPVLTHTRQLDMTNFAKAMDAAKEADVSIVFLGEEAILSGEAHSLSDLNLIGVQSELLKAIKSVGKPVVLVIMAGRPLTIEKELPYADALLYQFHPGTMGGPAILDLIFGRANPSGKLPVTFVKEVGQIPMYYNHNNTGRPAPDRVTALHEIPVEAAQNSSGNTSFYLDSGKDPLFPFGFGMSYSNFIYSDLTISQQAIKKNQSISVSVNIKNESKIKGTEVAQLYIRDLVGSLIRPVKELKGFKRITLEAGEQKSVKFTIHPEDLMFYNQQNQRVLETGDFELWIGTDSQAKLQAKFSVY